MKKIWVGNFEIFLSCYEHEHVDNIIVERYEQLDGRWFAIIDYEPRRFNENKYQVLRTKKN